MYLSYEYFEQMVLLITNGSIFHENHLEVKFFSDLISRILLMLPKSDRPFHRNISYRRAHICLSIKMLNLIK